jgi:hypothetical protein
MSVTLESTYGLKSESICPPKAIGREFKGQGITLQTNLLRTPRLGTRSRTHPLSNH